VARIVAQGIAFARLAGGPVLRRGRPLYLDAPDPGWARTVGAAAELERLVLGSGRGLGRRPTGMVLRYGTL